MKKIHKKSIKFGKSLLKIPSNEDFPSGSRPGEEHGILVKRDLLKNGMIFDSNYKGE